MTTEEFISKLKKTEEALDGYASMFNRAAYREGILVVLNLLIEEHELFLKNKGILSQIGPLFDAGIKMASEHMLESLKERRQALK